MVEVLISQPAENDYTESLQWYAARSRLAAEGFELEFSQATAAIAAHPDRFPRCDASHRFYLLRRYPFQVIYRSLPSGDCLIVAVAHTSRRPGYWTKR